jgi:glycosyltransferase involved in cell wall biosynthesis
MKYGGPTAAAVETALAIRSEGFDNEFVYIFRPDKTEDDEYYLRLLTSVGIRVHAFPASSAWSTAAQRWAFSSAFALWLLRAIRKYDVIHVHTAWTFTALWALLVARLGGKPIFLTPHESLTDFDVAKSPIGDRLVKRVLRFIFLRAFQRVIVASRLEQVDSRDAAGSYTTVVPHAVRGLGTATRIVNRAEPVVVGFLARLHPKKNLEIVLDALSRLDDRYRLRIAGDGPPAYVRSLRLRACDLRVDHRIEWLGFVTAERRRSFVEGLHVLAAPSAYECFCIAAAEALGAGVPVLVTPTVGVAEVVKKFDCGVVVSPEPEAVAAGIALLTDVHSRKRLSRNARLAAGSFSAETHGAWIRIVYGFNKPLESGRSQRQSNPGPRELEQEHA